MPSLMAHSLARGPDGGGQGSAPSGGDRDDYRRGNWENRSLFFPTIRDVEENAEVCAQFRRMVEAGDLDGTRLLLHAGVPPVLPIGMYRRTALHMATERNDVLMCQLLLSFHADPLQEDTQLAVARNKGAWTSLDIAIELEHLPLVHLFEMQARRQQEAAEAAVRQVEAAAQQNRDGCSMPVKDHGFPSPSKRSFPLRLEIHANERGFMPNIYA